MTIDRSLRDLTHRGARRSGVGCSPGRTEDSLMSIMKRWLCSSAIVMTLGVAPARVGAQTADVDGGRRLFQGMCVECHGAGGAGGEAPSLNRPRLTHAPDDKALANVIANGIPNTAMPRIRRFTESELKQLVAYVRSLGKIAQERVPGHGKK